MEATIRQGPSGPPFTFDAPALWIDAGVVELGNNGAEVVFATLELPPAGYVDLYEVEAISNGESGAGAWHLEGAAGFASTSPWPIVWAWPISEMEFVVEVRLQGAEFRAFATVVPPLPVRILYRRKQRIALPT